MEDDAGFAGRLGIRPERADDGRPNVRFQAAEEHLNPAGTVHGGVLPQAPSQGPAASVRAVGGEGVVSLTVCDADVEQDGRAIAHAVATFALLHG